MRAVRKVKPALLGCSSITEKVVSSFPINANGHVKRTVDTSGANPSLFEPTSITVGSKGITYGVAQKIRYEKCWASGTALATVV